MYIMIESENIARIPPDMLVNDYSESLMNVARETIEGKLIDVEDEETLKVQGKCYVVSVVDVKPIGEGAIVHGDGGVYQTIRYKAIAYYPQMHEVVDGVIISIKEFGAFVKIGPFDGLLHISQIMDDRIDKDIANQRLIGKDTKRDLKVGDRVRVRIVAMNLNSSSIHDSQIGLTMKQIGLGKLEWLEKARNKEQGQQ
ncbi:MAG: DNA-directed RNA polymerase [Thermoplasmataceae archaeon]